MKPKLKLKNRYLVFYGIKFAFPTGPDDYKGRFDYLGYAVNYANEKMSKFDYDWAYIIDTWQREGEDVVWRKFG